MKLKSFLVLTAAAGVVAFGTGAPSACDPENWLDPERYDELQKPATAKITVHKIIKYRQGRNTEVTIPTYSRQEITVDMPWFSSKGIEHIDAIPRKSPAGTYDGYYDLKLTLSPKGRREWIMLSNAHLHEDVAFVIDGVFYRSFRPRMLMNESDLEIIIDGPFDQATARELAYQSEFNYMKLNPQ